MTTFASSYTREIPATEARVGEYLRHYGRNSIGHEIVSVEQICNCEASARRLDPVTREPRHEPLIAIRTDDGRSVSYLPPTSTVTISDGIY